MPRLSPLDSEHRALGARMVEFGGWTMPIQYTGVLEEHRACRERAVIFDVSHLGSVRVKGAGAFDALQWAFTNDLRRGMVVALPEGLFEVIEFQHHKPGKGQAVVRTRIKNLKTGGVVDRSPARAR